MTSVMFAIAIVPAGAVSVNPAPNPNPQVSYYTGGAAVAASLMQNPEYLKVRTASPIHTTTTIIVQGLDENGQLVQASVTIPWGTQQEQQFLLNDTITNKPVVFAAITNIVQQNGTHNDQIQLWTQPEPYTNIHNNWAWPEYLGEFHTGFGVGLGWEPGQEHPSLPTLPPGVYYVPMGPFNSPGTSPFPPEPSNPDPVQVYINWIDSNLDMVPEGAGLPWGNTPSELATASVSTTLYFEGLDQAGNKLIGTAQISQGDINDPIVTPNGATFAVVCNVWTSATQSADSYYILTNPVAPRAILLYTIAIDHINLYPHSYDILANPLVGDAQSIEVSSQVPEPGCTFITAVLVDTDNNAVWTSANPLPTFPSNTPYVILNFYTTGGSIQPAYVKMGLMDNFEEVELCSDSNARTIKVFVDAIVPACTAAPAINIRSWIELTEDGVNSAFSTAWPIHQLMWGYNDTANPNGVTLPVTPKPSLEVLEDGLGEGIQDWGNQTISLDGPIYEISIPLYQGCNLISSPVQPMLGRSTEWPGGEFYSGTYPTMPLNGGIPMRLLFGATEAVETIDSIWWYNATTAKWYYFVPATLETNYPTENPMFTDGIGYWIKVEKPSTLEFSGILMENAPFTPEVYVLAPFKWNLLGFTSTIQITTTSYLEGLATVGYAAAPPGQGSYTANAGAIGIKAPVWVWDAAHQSWLRDPAMLWPTNAFWIFTSANRLAP